MIRVYDPWIAKNQKKYVNEALDSNMLTFHGKYVRMFEKSIEEKFGIRNCIATANGSVSLYTIYYNVMEKTRNPLRVQNTVFITSPMTYFATYAQMNLLPFQMEIAYTTFNDKLQMNINSCMEICKLFKKKDLFNNLIVVIPTLYGNIPNEITDLRDFCFNNDIPLIEDAAETFGCYNLQGFSGSFGLASSYSFFANKVITCGEGGAIVTNDDDFAKECRSFINQGNPTNYIHMKPGSNFRMTNIQAAIGYAQMEDYDIIVDNKKQIYDYYKKHINTNYVNIIEPDAGCGSTHWLCLFKTDLLENQSSYDIFSEYMRVGGIEVRPVFKPAYNIGSYTKPSLSFPTSSLKINTHNYFNLPSSPSLTKNELKYITETTNKFFERQQK